MNIKPKPSGVKNTTAANRKNNSASPSPYGKYNRGIPKGGGAGSSARAAYKATAMSSAIVGAAAGAATSVVTGHIYGDYAGTVAGTRHGSRTGKAAGHEAGTLAGSEAGTKAASETVAAGHRYFRSDTKDDSSAGRRADDEQDRFRDYSTTLTASSSKK